MNQQQLLRLAMQQSGHTRAILANALGVSPRTLAKWLLPESSGDFRRMPETAQRLLDNQYGIRKSADLSMPYDWTNPAMSSNKLITSVLRRGDFADVVRICAEFGLDKVRLQLEPTLALVPSAERGILSRILNRMFRSIEIALAERLAA